MKAEGGARRGYRTKIANHLFFEELDNPKKDGHEKDSEIHVVLQFLPLGLLCSSYLVSLHKRWIWKRERGN